MVSSPPPGKKQIEIWGVTGFAEPNLESIPNSGADDLRANRSTPCLRGGKAPICAELPWVNYRAIDGFVSGRSTRIVTFVPRNVANSVATRQQCGNFGLE
jgi:hypothetical protein